MPLTLVTPPTLAPVSLADAKVHLRVDGSAEDTLIEALISAATEDAEHVMQRAILPQQWLLTLDNFYAGTPAAAADVCNTIALQRPTVTTVNSVKYIDATTGTLTTLDSAEYQVDLSSPLQARLAPAYGKAWPDTRAQLGAVQVLFTAGWLTEAAVPPNIKAWVLLRVGALYQQREGWTQGKAIERNQFLDYMLDRWRVFTA